MKELMARELLMQDDLRGPIETSHFDKNVRFNSLPGAGHTDEASLQVMNHTEYSQFIKHQDVPSTKQDFNG